MQFFFNLRCRLTEFSSIKLYVYRLFHIFWHISKIYYNKYYHIQYRNKYWILLFELSLYSYKNTLKFLIQSTFEGTIDDMKHLLCPKRNTKYEIHSQFLKNPYCNISKTYYVERSLRHILIFWNFRNVFAPWTRSIQSISYYFYDISSMPS